MRMVAIYDKGSGCIQRVRIYDTTGVQKSTTVKKEYVVVNKMLVVAQISILLYILSFQHVNFKYGFMLSIIWVVYTQEECIDCMVARHTLIELW